MKDNDHIVFHMGHVECTICKKELEVPKQTFYMPLRNVISSWYRFIGQHKACAEAARKKPNDEKAIPY